MTTLAQFIEAHGIAAAAKRVYKKPGLWDAHWEVMLARPDKCRRRRYMHVTFARGDTHTHPSVLDVLGALAAEAAMIETAGDYAGWCADLGYNPYRYRYFKAYKASVEQSRRLEVFLGPIAYQALLWETDPE